MGKKQKQTDADTTDTAVATVATHERTLPSGTVVEFPDINDMMREAGIVDGINKTNAKEARSVMESWHDMISTEHREYLAGSTKANTDDEAGKKLRSDKLFRGAFKVGRSGLAPCCGYIDKESNHAYAEDENGNPTHHPLVSISNMGALYEMYRCDACNAIHKSLYGNGKKSTGPKKSEVEKIQAEIDDKVEVIDAMRAVNIGTTTMDKQLTRLKERLAKAQQTQVADATDTVDDVAVNE